MSCLSCKTNRYLTNIYKSQQRVTLSQSFPIPDFPAQIPPACSLKLCIVKRASNSNEKFGGSISSWVSREASQNPARMVSACTELARYLEDGIWNCTVWQWPPQSPRCWRREPNAAHIAHTQACNVSNQTGRVEPLHLALSHLHQRIPERVQLIA